MTLTSTLSGGDISCFNVKIVTWLPGMLLKFFACRATTLSTPTLPENVLHNIAILVVTVSPTIACMISHPEIPMQERDTPPLPPSQKAITETHQIWDQT